MLWDVIWDVIHLCISGSIYGGINCALSKITLYFTVILKQHSLTVSLIKTNKDQVQNANLEAFITQVGHPCKIIWTHCDSFSSSFS